MEHRVTWREILFRQHVHEQTAVVSPAQDNLLHGHSVLQASTPHIEEMIFPVSPHQVIYKQSVVYLYLYSMSMVCRTIQLKASISL